jgi:UDP-N-acetylglucosamine--N-acetylmuramyl-(pentapeptide) pyrophosphoryl-undecaprenol N-acetylglucosamine transferase
MNFVIAAGGTGGHLFPGMAVGEVLRARGHAVMLIVSEKEIDAVATEGRTDFQVEKVPGVGWQGRTPLALARFALKFWAGWRQCRALFARFAPAAVLGMGGFTSFAPILAGRRRGVPTYVHDSNAIPGKANKLNARYCTAVLLGFAQCAQHFPKSRCIVTGTPIRRSLAQRIDRAAALAEFGLSPARQTLLVMGGSQGARGLNAALVQALPALQARPVQIIHLTGKEDEARMREAYAQAGVPAFVAAFFHRMECAYSAADFAIARSGAASLTELSHFALPAVLVPYPHAAEDHQTRNAQIFAEAGAAVLLPERDLASGTLAEQLRELLEDAARRATMSARCAALAPHGAAERIADLLLAAQPT